MLCRGHCNVLSSNSKMVRLSPGMPHKVHLKVVKEMQYTLTFMPNQCEDQLRWKTHDVWLLLHLLLSEFRGYIN